MYKVLLVDDEKIILNGISRIVKWGDAGTELVGTASNGIEAIDFIAQQLPDIVVSDIRMPGMDGLTLVEKVYEQFPQIRFVMLSGFSDFDYAKRAMRFGVQHYLLKPCNEAQIEEALREVVADLRQSEGREQFVQQLKDGLQKVMPHVKAQFLEEFVTNKTYGHEDWDYYGALFNLDFHDKHVRLLLFELEGVYEYEHLFAVKNIAEDIIDRAMISTTVGKHVLLLLEEDGDIAQLYEHISEIRQTFQRFYKLDLTIAISEAGEMIKARTLYKQTLECLSHRFYLGEGSLIAASDIYKMMDTTELRELRFDEEQLMMHIKSGSVQEVLEQIDQFFHQLRDMRFDMAMAKSYVIPSYMAMIRLTHAESLAMYMNKLLQLLQLDTLPSIQQMFRGVASEIAQFNYDKNKKQHNAIVTKVLKVIEEHIADPELSLNWVANQMLYMNADYLGKLFKKETGEKFSNYVIQLRVTKAANLIARHQDVKIFEIAEQLGFGDNPQYFSQVFKKVVGCTPSEYMKSPIQLGILNKTNGFLD